MGDGSGSLFRLSFLYPVMFRTAIRVHGKLQITTFGFIDLYRVTDDLFRLRASVRPMPRAHKTAPCHQRQRRCSAVDEETA